MKRNQLFCCIHSDSSFSGYTGRILDHHPEIVCIQRPFDKDPLMRSDCKGYPAVGVSKSQWFLETKDKFNTPFFGVTSIARDALDFNFFRTGITVLRHPFCSWVQEITGSWAEGQRLMLSVHLIEEFYKYCSANLPSLVYWIHHSNLLVYYQDLLKNPEGCFFEMYRTIGARDVVFHDDITLPYDRCMDKINNPDMISTFLLNFPHKHKLPNDLEIL